MSLSWSELRRRRVPQTLGAYAGVCLAAWGGLEFASGAFDISEWVLRFVIIGSVLGLLPVAAAAWVFRIDAERGARRPLLTVGVAMFSVVGVVAVSLIMARRPAPAPATPTSRATILVLPFENLTGDAELDHVGAAAADWVAQGMREADLGGVVPTTAALGIARWLREQTAAGSIIDPVAAAAEETGASLILTGSFLQERDTFRFSIQITGVGDVAVNAAIDPVSAPVDALSGALQELRERAAGAVAVALDERFAPMARDQSAPTLEAYRHFQEGMELYMRLASRDALPHFQAAYEADTTFVEALYFIGMQYLNMAEPELARNTFGQVDARRARLTPYYRHMLDASIAFQRWDWGGAARSYKAAAMLAPASKAFYNWGFLAILAGRPREGLEAFSYLTPGRGTMRGWISLTSMIAETHHALGDYEAALAAAELHAELYSDRPLGNASYLGRELGALGRLEEVDALTTGLIGHVGSIETAGGTSFASVANTLISIGVELRTHGYPEPARRLLTQAVDWIETRPDQGSLSVAERSRQARALFELGRDDEALTIYDALHAELPAVFEYRGRRAVLLARVERIEEADEEMEELSKLGAEHYAWHDWASAVAMTLGDRDRAIAELEAALERGAARRLWHHTDTVMDPLRGDPRFRRLVAPWEGGTL